MNTETYYSRRTMRCRPHEKWRHELVNTPFSDEAYLGKRAQRERVAKSEALHDTVKKPFAFDLGREYELIQKHGESYRDYFFSQAGFYVKESYGKVKHIEYEHEIRTDSNGKPKLYFGPMNELAEVSYARPLQESGFPEWYRARAEADIAWVHQIETFLETAEDGDMFVDLSPTEYDITLDERKEWGFGTHSFVTVNQVVAENGKKKLVSRNLRNYLGQSEQEALFEKLTGEKVEGKNLLRHVGKLQPDVGLGHIEKFVNDLYQAIPEDQKLQPIGDQIVKSNDEMNEHINMTQPWMRKIFRLMRDYANPLQIEREFHAWEMAMQTLIQDKPEDKELIEELKHEMTMLDRLENMVEWNDIFQIQTQYPFSDNTKFAPYIAFSQHQAVSHFKQMDYKPGANGCGLGSGFSMPGSTSIIINAPSTTITSGGNMPINMSITSGNTIRESSIMTYTTITSSEWDHTFTEDGPCRICGSDAKCGPCKICELCNEKIDDGELVVEE